MAAVESAALVVVGGNGADIIPHDLFVVPIFCEKNDGCRIADGGNLNRIKSAILNS